MDGTSPASNESPVAALFVTCLVDFFRPSIGFAAVRLLERAGYRVEVPTQSCCGQPGYSSGHWAEAREVARRFIETFEPYEVVVAPSGSCVEMVASYHTLFEEEPSWLERARSLADKTFELTTFLSEQVGLDALEDIEVPPLRATYHDSCSGLRGLGISEQPRALLAKVQGLTLVEYGGAKACCGFGGTFCVKYPDVSKDMSEARCNEIEQADADTLIGGDLGCLLVLAGSLSRNQQKVQVRHVAEVLCGDVDGPAIGEPENE